MKYIHYNENKVLGFYDPEIHQSIPEPNFAITDDVWMAYLWDQGSYRVEGGALVYAPIVPTAEEVQAQQLAALNAEYELRRRQLWDYLNLAVNYWQDATYAAEIRAELNSLEEEYNEKAGEIINGE
jgi:hypothetical protein